MPALFLWVGVTTSVVTALGASSDYSIEVWQVEQGLPDNTVTTIAQTPDGYLWFGTFNGLVRFDGIRFKVFDSRTPGLESERILCLFVDGAGGMWLSMEHGQLARYADGHFTSFHERDGWPMRPCRGRGMAEERTGTMLFLTEPGDLFRFDGKRFAKVLAGPSPKALLGCAVDSIDGGHVWAKPAKGVGLVKGDQWIEFQAGEGESLTEESVMTASREGGIWIVSEEGQILRLTEAHGKVAALKYPLMKGGNCMHEDTSGRIWIGTWGNGLARVSRDGSYQNYGLDGGLPSSVIRAIFEDREGNLWIATNGGGLVRLKPKAFFTYDRFRDFPSPHSIPLSLAEDASGRLWIGCLDDGALQMEGGRLAGSVLVTARRGGDPGIWAVLPSTAGGMWFGTYGEGLVRAEAGSFARWSVAHGLHNPHVTALAQDRDGTLWVGTLTGLSRFNGSNFTKYTTHDGLLANQVRALALDKFGALWIGTLEGGLNRLHEGRLSALTNGLPHTSVRALLADADRSLWIGTGRGLCLLRDNQFTRFDATESLTEAAITVILDDEVGHLWLGSNHGVLRVARAELEAVVRGEKRRVECTAYGRSDGLASAQCSIGHPAGLRTRDGRLWFATVNGLSVVDPRALPRNTNAPPVVIEEVLVDGALVWSSASEPGVRVPTTSTKVRVPPGPRRVEIRYTALSLTAPERVQFQRKIEGFDEDWLNVGTDRVASYQGLPPGEYGFRVIAANNDGVWNREGARLALIVQPAIWQTAWFRAGMAAALVGAAVAAYRRRIGMLERRRIQQDAFARQVLESQEAERRRIAAELHDGLGQDLVLAKNLALLGGQTSRGDSAVAERFTEISSATTRALDEVHAISYALRPPELDRLGLARALAEMIRRAEESSGIRFERRLDLTGPLPPGADIQIFRIAQEAVNNLVRHSGAKSARMDLWSDDAGVHLVVADDGRGFAITAHERSGLGLTGIAERVRLLGGRHDLVSRPGQGTTLTVLIPTATPPR